MRDCRLENMYDFNESLRIELKLMLVSTAQPYLPFNSLNTVACKMTIWPTMPDCGVYLAWPCEGIDWIHPEDVTLVEQWIPSSRVFRRHSFDGMYYELQYGHQRVRVKPTLWHRVEDEGFSVGDRVEVLSHFQENDPCLGVISEIRFDKASGQIVYSIETRELRLPRPFFASDLVQLERKMQLRKPDENNLL